MLECTDGYKRAIVGDTRRMYIKAMLAIIDPDIVYGASNGSGAVPWSKPAQLHDKKFELERSVATLELNRWLLDGSFGILPDDAAQLTGEVGHVGNVLSGDDGTFSGTVYAELAFSGVDILQACSVYFSADALDGIGVDFTVSILSSGQVVYQKSFTGNTAVSVSLDGFTIYDPTAIRVTVTKWSLPHRRLRVAEIVPGLYEEWTDDVLASISIQQRGNFACLSIPYGTCTLKIDNLDRRFEPRNKNGIFQSIEERQGLPVAIGVLKEDGSTEWKQAGVYYQYSGGWRTSDNSMTMQWDLVDIVGLVADREFIWTGDLPTTLGGWIAAIVSQLGVNFTGKYHVDPDYADLAATVNSADDVTGKKCGDILRWVCMATGTWPRADAETGDLTTEPFWGQGNKLDLDNLVSYPTMKANDDLAALIFKLYDTNGTTYVVSGNATSSSQTLTVSNPFIHTEAQALTAAKQILSQYGGIKLETTGRGDPASEIGDVDVVWLDESSAATGRRMEQSFSFSGGVLRDCKSVLLQADGSFQWENRLVVTESGTFHTGPSTTQLRLVLSQGGQGGAPGEDGSFSDQEFGGSDDGNGADGRDGDGGLIWAGIIDVNPDTDYAIVIGKGGASSTTVGVAGEAGTHTTFGVHSSASGKLYPMGYSDIASGSSYGRSGVASPVNGTGDGGRGGKGGQAGVRHREQIFDVNGKPAGSTVVIDVQPGKGKPGVPGADGVCVIYWDKE